MASFQKDKSTKNSTGPGFRTSDHFKGSVFSGGSKFSGGQKLGKPVTTFNPSQFKKTQHKG